MFYTAILKFGFQMPIRDQDLGLNVDKDIKRTFKEAQDCQRKLALNRCSNKPIAQRHDREKDEDTADTDHEHDHHDDGVAVRFFY